MTRRTVPRRAVLALLAPCIVGCGPGVWSDPPPPPLVTTICILDTSGSVRQSLQRAVQDVCIDAIETSPPGLVIVRRLNGAAALNEAELVRLTIPRAAPCDNPFSPRCREKGRAQNSSLAEARAGAVARVREATREPHSRTDLLGALAAAAQTFDAMPNETERVLIVVSDLDGTVHRPLAPLIHFPSVDVIAVVQNSADAAADRRLQDHFRTLVTEAGARSIRILPLSPTHP